MRASGKRKRTVVVPGRVVVPGITVTVPGPFSAGAASAAVSPVDGSGIVKTPSLGGASLAEKASTELQRIERILS